MNREADEQATFDYIVVGSGAGGGPLAANLAKAGHSVLLMEAGGRDKNYNSQIPVFHGKASEDPALKWDFYVKHYGNEEQQRKDTKYVTERDGVPRNGILYPRAGTLGGCTEHNAMITVYPHNRDWDHIAELTGDDSWRSDRMRPYFERLERCTYYPGTGFRAFIRRVLEFLRLLPKNAARHGSEGWLSTSTADPRLAFKDSQLVKIIKSAVKAALFEHIGDPLARVRSDFDPNDWRLASESPEGIAYTPLATRSGKRCSTRDYLLAIEKEADERTNQKKYRLTILSHALATRVLLDEGKPPTAVGVEYMAGNSLYRADPRAFSNNGEPQPLKTVRARREVILGAGAFNTPQLLKLSGIGPPEELARFGIPVRVKLKGVGENLQDRYEVGVITELKHDFDLLKGAPFKTPVPNQRPDPLLQDWEKGIGVYTTNGSVIGIIKRSKPNRPDPDLYIFGLPGYFKGYEPGYSNALGVKNNYFTWAILKAHTNNTAGTVRLRSRDPRDMPEINFRYFDEGNDRSGEDLESVVEGVEFVRHMNKRIDHIAVKEELPGTRVQTREQIRDFIKQEAWGHHASCTCKIGKPDDDMAVLDSKFRVRGVKRLRVVDASVFPNIPGMFIVTAIYMISEKASDVILADAGTSQPAVSRRV